MFKVKIEGEGFNVLQFQFETLEGAQDFIRLAINSVDEEYTRGIKATITYKEEYAEEI